MSRFRCWLVNGYYAVVAKYRTWLLFRSQPWRKQPAKRRTP